MSKEKTSYRMIRNYPIALRLELKSLAARMTNQTGKYISLQALEVRLLKEGADRIKEELDNAK